MKIFRLIAVISILIISGFFIAVLNIGTLRAQVSEVVSTAASSSIATGQVTVDSTAGGTLIRGANRSRRSIIIRNQGTQVDLYVGPAGLTTATGLLVKPGESLTLDRNTAAIYGITAAALSTTVGYLEE